MEIKSLDADLIYRANSNSMSGNRGNMSNAAYIEYANKILSWPVSDAKKEKLLDVLYKKRSEILKYEAQFVSVMVAGPARYNAKKLDKSDKILELSSEFCSWWDGLKQQIKQGTSENKEAERLLSMIEFCRRPDNPCNPTKDLEKLALYDSEKFIELYQEMYQEYKWRKNSNIAKLYLKATSGELKQIKKEVFFEDENMTAYLEKNRVFIKFLMKPKRQLMVALKSRGYWWNSNENAWSTYVEKLDKEWIASISSRYAEYV